MGKRSPLVQSPLRPRALPASFVVRVYRADPACRNALAGLVEDLEQGRTHSFRTGDELLQQLAAPDACAHRVERVPESSGVDVTPPAARGAADRIDPA